MGAFLVGPSGRRTRRTGFERVVPISEMNPVEDSFAYSDEWLDNGECEPFVREHKGVVYLHFHRFQVQSEMFQDAPDELVPGYSQTMMDFLRFNRQPDHIGMIGLGGGSIPKYCYRHLPRTTISVAEINPDVIGLRDQFFIPQDDHRFRVYCEDG